MVDIICFIFSVWLMFLWIDQSFRICNRTILFGVLHFIFGAYILSIVIVVSVLKIIGDGGSAS